MNFKFRNIKNFNSIYIIYGFIFLLQNTAFSQSDTTKNILNTFIGSDNFRFDSIPNDTSLQLFHIYKDFDKRSIAESFLGNLGSANYSNIYNKQVDDYGLDFLFNKPYDTYLIRPENIKYYNTRRPYTDIYYFSSTKIKDEQSLFFTHTQNVSSKLNVGINYKLVSSQGNYSNQQTKNHGIAGQSSYSADKYSMNFSICYNKFTLADNGGLIDTGNVNINALEAYLLNAETKLSGRYIYLTQKYHIGNYKGMLLNDTVIKIFKPSISFVHNFTHNKSYRLYSDTQNDENNYYNNFYYDIPEQEFSTYDSIFFRNLSNSFGVQSEDSFINKRKFGFDIIYKNELKKYSNFKQYLLFENEHKFIDNSVIFNLFNDKRKKTNLNLYANYYFSGYRSGDMKLSGKITRKFGNTDSLILLRLKLSSINQRPDFFTSNYYSNHYRWENNFTSIKTNKIDFDFSIPRFYLKAGINMSFINNYVYFGKEIVPVQYNKSLNIISAYISKDFNLGIFKMLNKIIWQKVSNSEIVSMPQLSAYNATFIDFRWKSLQVNLGFDVYYTTKYKMYGYNPAIGNFYLDNTTETGNYPFVSAFASGKVKSNVLLFIKLEHANAGLFRELYYNVNHYPLYERMTKFGIRWTFTN